MFRSSLIMKQLRSYQVELRDFLDLHVRLVRSQGRQYLFDGKSLQGITNLEGVFKGGIRSNTMKSRFPHDATELSHTLPQTVSRSLGLSVEVKLLVNSSREITSDDLHSNIFSLPEVNADNFIPGHGFISLKISPKIISKFHFSTSIRQRG
jgi:hypothetical protein